MHTATASETVFICTTNCITTQGPSYQPQHEQ